jgi:hypothetical protein
MALVALGRNTFRRFSEFECGDGRHPLQGAGLHLLVAQAVHLGWTQGRPSTAWLRMGHSGGKILLVEPDWQGEKPEGFLDVIRMTTNYGGVFPRSFAGRTPEAAARSIACRTRWASIR